MENFVASLLVYGSIFALCAVIIGLIVAILGQSLRFLIPLSYILLLPFYIPYWTYLFSQPKFEWDQKAKDSLLFEFKKLFLFYGRLITWRKPFLY